MGVHAGCGMGASTKEVAPRARGAGAWRAWAVRREAVSGTEVNDQRTRTHLLKRGYARPPHLREQQTQSEWMERYVHKKGASGNTNGTAAGMNATDLGGIDSVGTGSGVGECGWGHWSWLACWPHLALAS